MTEPTKEGQPMTLARLTDIKTALEQFMNGYGGRENPAAQGYELAKEVERLRPFEAKWMEAEKLLGENGSKIFTLECTVSDLKEEVKQLRDGRATFEHSAELTGAVEVRCDRIKCATDGCEEASRYIMPDGHGYCMEHFKTQPAAVDAPPTLP